MRTDEIYHVLCILVQWLGNSQMSHVGQGNTPLISRVFEYLNLESRNTKRKDE